ncbi:CU044_5270 family protein [Streptosporangium sp. CA-115845]|uniref:CU044_5270 family protein n=1 Tax=Streptosporangium sp. CA-115845 TaxID=3240071 RepID=UPI003D91016D
MNEIEMLRQMRDEVPEQPDVSEVRLRMAAHTERAPARRTRPAYRMRFGLALATAGVLAAATTVILVRPGGGGPETGPTSSSAAMVLERAALMAAQSTAAEIRPDQWFYLKESQHMGADLPAFETWNRMDGIRSALREEGRELKVGPVEKGPTTVRRTQQEVEALPTDPDALLRHFRGDAPERTPLSICGPSCPPEVAQDAKTFGTIGWYMKYGPVIPPDTAAAMFRALAKIPHVSVEEDATDMDGRHGVGVVFDAGEHGKLYYVLNSGDYRYMGVKVVRDGQSTGTSVLGSGIVDRAGDTP